MQRHTFHLKLSTVVKQEIHGELANVYGSSAASYAQVQFWEEMCMKVRYLVYSDMRIQVEEIAHAIRHFTW